MQQLNLDNIPIQNNSQINSKKINQQIAGTKAQQKGENIKNQFTAEVSWVETGDIKINLLKKKILECFQIEKGDVLKISSRAYADGGKEKSVKPDNRTTIKFKNNKKQIDVLSSLKSTFGATQLAVHSLTTFKKHLLDVFSINIPDEALTFLSLFTNSGLSFIGNTKPTHNPSYKNINERRCRFAADDIISFDEKLYESFIAFIKNNARELLTFLMASGTVKSKDKYANCIIFVNNNYTRVEVYKIEELISKSLENCAKNNDWVILGKCKKDSGITTIDLYGGLITLQMKGSGKGASYHHLQFRISGNKVIKLLEKWG